MGAPLATEAAGSALRARETRIERFDDAFHLHAARTFHQQKVSALDQISNERAGLRGRREKFCLRGRMAGFDGAANEIFRVALHADDPVEFPGRRSRASGLAMQFGGSGPKLQHFACGENVTASRGRAARAARPSPQAPQDSSCSNR